MASLPMVDLIDNTYSAYELDYWQSGTDQYVLALLSATHYALNVRIHSNRLFIYRLVQWD